MLRGAAIRDAHYSTTCTVAALPVAHLAGHEHIAPGRKADPGPGLDWTLLQNNLALPDQCFPNGVLKTTKHIFPFHVD